MFTYTSKLPFPLFSHPSCFTRRQLNKILVRLDDGGLLLLL